MRIAGLSRAVALGLCLALPVRPATAQEGAAEALDAYAARALEDWSVPGLALAVVAHGELVLAKGYGVRAMATGNVVDENTLFAIGSTTKAMTAACIGLLVEEGRLGWDDPVTKHLPAFRLRDPWVTREVTVRDLLTHRAGLGNADFLWYGSDRTRAEILAGVPYIEPAYSMRAGFVYQNIMYVAAGELAADVSGGPWEALVAARLFGPLGMTRTVPTTSAAQRMDNVARPHAEADGALAIIDNEILDSIAPAGAVWSSAADLSRWVRMLLARGEWNGERILAEETVAELLEPQTLLDLAPYYPYVRLLEPHWTSYGLGWFQLDYHGRFVCFHTGSIDGMSAIVGLVPDEELGVVVLANRDHAEVRHALLWKALDLFAGLRDGRDWSVELKELYDAEAARAEEREQEAREKRVADTSPSLQLSAYAGAYTHPLMGRVEVELADDGLHLVAGPRLSGSLEHWNYDTFQVRWDRRWQGEALATFELDAAGTPAHLELLGLTLERAAEKE